MVGYGLKFLTKSIYEMLYEFTNNKTKKSRKARTSLKLEDLTSITDFVKTNNFVTPWLH